MKETQGSVEVTSYGQMRNILRYGRYKVGTADQAHTIHDLISLKLILRGKQLSKTSYNLDELRDLESKLVLITGSKAECRMEVDHYLNVSEYSIPLELFFILEFCFQILQHVIRIAEVLLALQQAGNVEYSGWMVTFDCATYTVTGHGQKQELVQLQEETATQRVAELHASAKNMESALREWENKVKESRSHHYELNYYTTLQLLRLRKELGHVRCNPGKPIDPEILALLESISPEVTSEIVHIIMTDLEEHLLDLHDATNLIPEELYEEVDVQGLASALSGSVHTDSLINPAVGTDVHVTTSSTIDPLEISSLVHQLPM